MAVFQVTMKGPDTLHDACREAAENQLREVEGIDDEEREALVDHRAENLSSACGKWFCYSEYLTVEIDTDAGTCVVKEQ